MNSGQRAVSGVAQHFKHFILHQYHPCVMAKAVFQAEQATIKDYQLFADKSNQRQLLKDLADYIDQVKRGKKNENFSFIAVFSQEHPATEEAFERQMWKLLQQLHNLDDQPWDPTVSSNPEDDNFSFSLQRRSFYLVGLHPKSSRKARQAPYTSIVFNLHEQFENLRDMGVYNKVRDRIRKRDKKHQGSINPMLKNFGVSSEAKQYAGRKVGENWKCPFSAK